MAAKKTTTFEQATKLPIGQFVEKKGGFSYLSWSHAVKVLRIQYPEATWWIEKGPTGMPYTKDACGCFIEVIIELGEGQRFQLFHPVLDHRNKTVKEPDSFTINTSIMRALTKAISVATGIGIDLYAGIDLPVEPDKPVAPPPPVGIEPQQTKDINIMGREYYQKTWEDERPEIVKIVTNGEFTSLTHCTKKQAFNIIRGIQKKLDDAMEKAAAEAQDAQDINAELGE